MFATAAPGPPLPGLCPHHSGVPGLLGGLLLLGGRAEGGEPGQGQEDQGLRTHRYKGAPDFINVDFLALPGFHV